MSKYTLFKGGAVYTANPAQRRAEAVITAGDS